MVVATFETMYSLRDTPDLGKLKKSFHLSGIVLPVLLASWPQRVWDRGSSEGGKGEQYALLLLFMGMPTAEATAGIIRKATADLTRSRAGIAQKAWDMLFELAIPQLDRVRHLAQSTRRKPQAASDFDEAAFKAVLKPASNVAEVRDEIVPTFKVKSRGVSRYVDEAPEEPEAPLWSHHKGAQTQRPGTSSYLGCKSSPGIPDVLDRMGVIPDSSSRQRALNESAVAEYLMKIILLTIIGRGVTHEKSSFMRALRKNLGNRRHIYGRLYEGHKLPCATPYQHLDAILQEKIEKSDAFVKLDHDPAWEMSKPPVGVKTAFIKIGVVPKGIEQSAIVALSQDWASREDIEEYFEDVSVSDIRIITDCTPINDMFNMFPMELPKVRLFNLVNPNDDLFSIDASNGFHLIPIAEDFQKFFTFSLNGGFYRCTKLCFGVTFGPAIFSVLMNLALAPMRALGYQLWAYIDDVFGWQSPDRRGRYRSASDAMRLLKLICFWLDITINKKKSVEPCKKLDVIGFTITSTFGPPDDPNMKVALAPSDANCQLASKCTAFRAASRKLHVSAITINAIIHEALKKRRKDKDGIPGKITKWLMTRSLTIGDQDLKEVQHHEYGQIEAQPKATDPTSGSPLGFIGTNEAHHLADAAVSEEKISIAGTAFATDDVDETCFEHLLLRSGGGIDLAKNELIDRLNMLSAKDKAKAIQKTKLSIAYAETEPLMAMLHSLGSKLSNGYLVLVLR
ncbi:hypothetical protein PCE1_004059 [Barthelona sp. PCE]